MAGILIRKERAPRVTLFGCVASYRNHQEVPDKAGLFSDSRLAVQKLICGVLALISKWYFCPLFSLEVDAVGENCAPPVLHR